MILPWSTKRCPIYIETENHGSIGLHLVLWRSRSWYRSGFVFTPHPGKIVNWRALLIALTTADSLSRLSHSLKPIVSASARAAILDLKVDWVQVLFAALLMNTSTSLLFIKKFTCTRIADVIWYLQEEKLNISNTSTEMALFSANVCGSMNGS